VIEDLMALTFALLHAADRVSWLAVLRARWCGLTLDDLHALAAADHHATIWDLLHRTQVTVSPDGRERVARILPAIEKAIAERGRQPLREWVENTWLQLGGPACVEDETALEDAGAYFDLLDGLAEGADLADFYWFREQVNALFAQPNASAADRLQLMTIHKAKGLEFDTVILPGLDAPPRSEDQRLLLWLEHRGELLLAPIGESGGEKDAIYAYLARIERLKSDQETVRLLYVAATRARENLHLLGSVRIKDDGTVAQPDSRSLLKLLWPMLAGQFANPGVAAEAEQEPRVKTIRRLPASWRLPPTPPAVKWKRPPMERVERPGAAYEWASDRARYAGAALHGFLQRIAREGLNHWDEARVRSQRGAYRAVLANLGVPAGDLAWAVERVESALLRTLRDARGRWLFEDHRDAASELPIAGLIAGDLCQVVIDRTFVDENGVRWIIDYKTSSHEGASLENFLEQEKDRYREQLERYARLMLGREECSIRLGLYFPLLSEWIEWAAPAPLRKQAVLFEL
jgi:ATP-dependent helicase/nuclease subunit A